MLHPLELRILNKSIKQLIKIMNTTSKIFSCFAFFLFFNLIINAQSYEFSLDDFYEDNEYLTYLVDSVFENMNEKDRVAQMIITSAGENGKPDHTVERLIRNKMTGGVILMKGGRDTHKNRVAKFNKLASEANSIPLLFSMDAEPSLLNGRLIGSPKMGQTNDIKDIHQSDSVVNIINDELKYVGVHHNYAPVLDISDSNAAIKKRSYGNDPVKAIELCDAFIQASQASGIIATAKHFPGHGLVKGDTHAQSVYIDGEMLELDNYRPIIDNGVLTVMVAHIVVKNNSNYNTGGKPATLSRKIVTELLKEEMNFKGLVITDALNIMKAVTIYDNAPLMASKAGCDLLLMPKNEQNVINNILNEMVKDPNYAEQVNESVRKILRMKFCVGIL